MPDAGIITGPGVVCVSDAITLTDTATAGTWTATNSSANVMGGAVSGVTAGIDTINYMVVNSCGSISATAIVTVNPMPFVPAAISGLSTVCAGGASSLETLVAWIPSAIPFQIVVAQQLSVK